jgi:hypothetical protein
MNIQRHAVSILASLAFCMPILPASARTVSKGGKTGGASAAVRTFYRYHFAHDKAFSKPNVERRRRWLAPELYRLLLNEFARYETHRKTNPDDAPYMEGDPFTDTQEYPDSYRVGASVAGSDDSASVPVTFLSHGRESGKIEVEVMRRGGAWLILNLHYEGDEADLLTQLRRPEYDSEVKRPGK